MKQEHILEALVNAIDVEIDGKGYVLRIDEVKEGEHWREKLGNDVKCKECEHFVPLFECEGECKNGFYIVSPDGSCGKGKRKGGKE